MTQRERYMSAVVVGLLLLVAAVVLFDLFYLQPLHERDEAITAARAEIDDKWTQMHQTVVRRAKLERYKQLSLPSNLDLARREYQKWLIDLLRDSGFEPGSFQVTSTEPDTRGNGLRRGKQPVSTPLTFTVVSHGDLESLVKVLEGFYRAPMLHQIQTFTVRRAATGGTAEHPNILDINLKIEALIVAGSDPRPQLLPNIDARYLVTEAAAALPQGPTGLALAAWAAGPTGPLGPGTLALKQRHYAAIAAKNVFFGRPEVQRRDGEYTEMTQFWYLTDITGYDHGLQGWLYERTKKDHRTRLRASAGFDRFRIIGDDGEVQLEGKVVCIHERDIVFQAKDKYYVLHVGQSLQEALAKSLRPEEVATWLAQAAASRTGADSQGPRHR
ncbi:MAG TPA: hypothetical protein VG013_38400 [Gemmataceae bacterium]|jgi:hypothetical protein|nr:hypothetical protein [Gemmataceae bacterium]